MIILSKDLIIGVSGIIGVGKSTLSRKLGEVLGAQVMYEPVETNEYLAKFYKDMTKYSFPMQVYLLNHRFAQHQQMVWSGKNTIQDRTLVDHCRHICQPGPWGAAALFGVGQRQDDCRL